MAWQHSQRSLLWNRSPLTMHAVITDHFLSWQWKHSRFWFPDEVFELQTVMTFMINLILIVFAPWAESLILVEFFLILASHYKDNEKFWEEIIAYFLFTSHWMLGTTRMLRISCRINMFTEPLPSNDREGYTYRHTDIQTYRRHGDLISVILLKKGK
jgi:transposase